MKRIILFVLYILLPIIANATAQESEIIYINGVKWELLDRPVFADSTLYNNLIAALPSRRSISTGNWDGFTAYWSVTRNKLYLDSIRCQFYDKDQKTFFSKSIPTDTLLRVFSKYVDGNHIVASWLTKDIRIATGEQIYYLHDGFERYYENERILCVKHGQITKQKVYHNHVVKGFSFDYISWQDFQAELKKKFPLHIERYPELANVKRIIFHVKRAKVDAQGNLVECELTVARPKGCEKLAEEMAALMKAYTPWRVLYIHGEYRAYGIERYTFPYIIDKMD